MSANYDDLPNLLPTNYYEENQMDTGIEEYFKIAIDGLEFQYLYKEIGARKAVFVIDKNGKECASIYVDVNYEEEDNNTRELLLSKVIYKPSCTFNGDMTRGLPTVRMLKGLMVFAMKKIPGFQYIVFTDDSKITCEISGMNKQVDIPLALFEFVLNGKTWYERHFGAILDESDIERRMRLDSANALLLKSVEGEFTSFWLRMLRLGSKLNGIEWYKDLKRLAKGIFENHVAENKSWRSFFNEIFGKAGTITKTLGENVGCSLFTTMELPIKEMFNIPNLEQTHWKIFRSTIEAYPEFGIEAEPNFTPKHIKKSDTKMKLAALSDPFFGIYSSVGGGKTRNNKKRLKYIPRGYGGVISYIAMNFQHRKLKNVTRRNRK